MAWRKRSPPAIWTGSTRRARPAARPTTRATSITGATLAPATNAKDYDFGELLPASISGYVYADINNNGVMDPGEPGIAGVQVTLVGQRGQSDRHDRDHRRQRLLPVRRPVPGVYGVAEAQPAGYLAGWTRRARPAARPTIPAT